MKSLLKRFMVFLVFLSLLNSSLALTESETWTITSDVESYFGNSVANIGDFNNDGYDDFAIGASEHPSGTRRGRVYIYYGDGLNSHNFDQDDADVRISGLINNEGFGVSISGAGDFNNDGYDDLIVGSNNENRAYLFYGGSLSGYYDASDADVNFIESSGSNFGRVVGDAGDFNNDGYDDVMIVDYAKDADGYTASGQIALFYGNNFASGTNLFQNNADVFFNGNQAYGWLGQALSSAGDFNNDGYDDVVIGSWRSRGTNPSGSFPRASSGQAFVYYGGNHIAGTNFYQYNADITINGTIQYGYLGMAVNSAGDVNDDGYDDVVVGAPGYETVSTSNEGQALLFYGGAGLSGTTYLQSEADVIITGIGTDSLFGIKVDGGDVNNDGHSDLIIGAEQYGGGPFSRLGGAFIFSGIDLIGSNYLASDASVIIQDNNYHSGYGTVLSCAGDANNDGSDEVLVSSPMYGSSDEGRVRVYEFSDTLLKKPRPAFPVLLQQSLTFDGENDKTFKLTPLIKNDLSEKKEAVSLEWKPILKRN